MGAISVIGRRLTRVTSSPSFTSAEASRIGEITAECSLATVDRVDLRLSVPATVGPIIMTRPHRLSISGGARRSVDRRPLDTRSSPSNVDARWLLRLAALSRPRSALVAPEGPPPLDCAADLPFNFTLIMLPTPRAWRDRRGLVSTDNFVFMLRAINFNARPQPHPRPRLPD